MEDRVEIYNPYAVTPAAAQTVDMDTHYHSHGNALAANLEAQSIAMVKMTVMAAHEWPRDPAQSMERILHECERPTLAESAVYSYPRSGETVTGPSIRLAEVLARQWGNIYYSFNVIQRTPGKGRTPGSSVISAYAWDLESNVFVERRFEVQHYRSTKSGGYAITDDRDIYELESNMASRRMRACILQLIPGDVTQAAVNACRRTTSSGIVEAMKDPRKKDAMIAKVIKTFAGLGATQDDLEDYLKVKRADWNADHIMKLKEVKTSLDDKQASVGDFFPRLAVAKGNEVITKEQVKALMEAAKATGMQGKISEELKKVGISKMADIPAARYDEVLALIQSFGEPVKTPPEPLPPAAAEPQPETLMDMTMDTQK